MNSNDEQVVDAINSFFPVLVNALDTLAYIGRHLHPPQLDHLLANVESGAVILAEHINRFHKVSWPDHLLPFKLTADASANLACKAFEALAQAKTESNGIFTAYKALGQYTKSVEALYPLASVFPPLSLYYLNDRERSDEALLQKLAKIGSTSDGLGVIHVNNERSERGGYSLYVPEYYDKDTPMPLIMALHGGSGHGRNFLWTWLKAARSRGAILVCPTSVGNTWSLSGPDRDSLSLEKILSSISSEWNVDQQTLLLTGMSDGGTYTYLNGLQNESPFTHLAPISASFHPLLLQFADSQRLKDLPLYLVHGILDWMFTIDMANAANESLKNSGVNIKYRPIADLSHTYPIEENANIMDWFLS